MKLIWFRSRISQCLPSKVYCIVDGLRHKNNVPDPLAMSEAPRVSFTSIPGFIGFCLYNKFSI